MRKVWFVVLLFILVIAICLGYVLLKPRNAGPVVNASRLPAFGSALKAKVTLAEVTRLDKRTLYARFIVQGKQGPRAAEVDYDDPTAIVDGKPLSREQCRSTGTQDSFINQIEIRSEITLPPHGKTLNVVVPVLLARKGHIRFKNISPSKLPSTRMLGSTEMIIERVYLMGLNDFRTNRLGSAPVANSGKTICVIDMKCRTNSTRISESHVRIGKNSSSIGCTGYTDARWLWSIDFTNGGGKSFPCEAASYHSQTHLTAVYLKEANHREAMDMLVGKVSRKLASKMIANRAMSAATKSGDVYACTFALDTSGKLPKRFNLDAGIKLPPTPDRQATVTFTNIKIPPP